MDVEALESVYWRTAAPTAAVPAPAELPPTVDVAVIGAGYTGLAAARALGREGASVVVLERDRVGSGASSRNGGMVLPGYKADLADLVRRHGLARARTLWQDSLEAIDFVERVIGEEGIACEWRRAGHVTLAARPAHLHDLEAAGRMLARDFGYQTELLGPGEIGREIGSSRYHGGLVDPLAGALQPAAWLAGLARSALGAGAVIAERTGVTAIHRSGDRTRLETGRGPVTARDVIVATNGYTGRLTPYLARRVVPVGSFIVATEPLGEERARGLMPGNRMYSDTKNLLYYFRLSSDWRLIFGGRAAFVPTALARSRELLVRGIAEVFPGLERVRIEHAWGGTLGFTLDHLPHAGRQDGVSHGLGYGGHGVALASWLGDRIGRAIAGSAPWPALADIPFPAIPLYHGRPWFLPLAGAYYGLKDRLR